MGWLTHCKSMLFPLALILHTGSLEKYIYSRRLDYTVNRIKLILAAALTLVILPLTASAVPLMTETIENNYYFTWDKHTYMYASIIDFYQDQPDVWNDGVWIGTGDGLDQSLSWAHTLPPGLQVPPDAVTKATIKIDGEYVDMRGNLVEIQGTWDWNPLEHMWTDNTVYSLTAVDQAGFWNGGFLGVNIFAGETDLRIDEAVLMMDYAYAVPEPAGMVLMGLGLAGAIIYRRIRRA